MYKRQALTIVYDVVKADISEKTKLALLNDFDQVLALNLTTAGQERLDAVSYTHLFTCSKMRTFCIKRNPMLILHGVSCKMKDLSQMTFLLNFLLNCLKLSLIHI